MTLEAALGRLLVRLVEMDDAVQWLWRVTVRDAPSDAPALVDHLDGSIKDLEDLVRVGRMAVEDAQASALHSIDPSRLNGRLEQSQHSTDAAARVLLVNLMALDRIEDMRALGREREGQWSAWVSEAIHWLERGRDALLGVAEALGASWIELARSDIGLHRPASKTRMGQGTEGLT